MNISKNKPILIFLANFDWRDIFSTSFIELTDKMERDRLCPSINNFFIFSYARRSYKKLDGQFKTVHKKTHIDTFRPLLDMWTLCTIPYVAWKYKVRPDVWVAYDFGMIPGLWIAQVLFGGKVVMCLNNQPRVYSRTRRFGAIKEIYSWFMERTCVHFVKHFFTINETMREYIKKIGVADLRITVFSMNTIDRDQEFISKAIKGNIRSQYHIDPNKKIIVTVARLEAEKNYPELLKLFAGLGSDYVLFGLGRGSLLQELTVQAKELGIADRVFFPGFVHRDQIWNYYVDADVFVLISKAEALGVVFWEAMHVGVPVIGSKIDGIVETIGVDGDRGRIWTPADGLQGFVERVVFCTTQSLDRNAMLGRARAYVDTQRTNTITINDVVCAIK